MSVAVALFCTFIAGKPFVGTLAESRVLPTQEASAEHSESHDVELLILSGNRLYRVIGSEDDGDEPYKKGEEITVPEGPCDSKIG